MITLAVIVGTTGYLIIGGFFVNELNNTGKDSKVKSAWKDHRWVRVTIRLSFLFGWFPIIIWGIVEKIIKGLFK